MSGLNTELRILHRIIIETFKGIKRTQWMNIVIIMTMAAILSIFGCLLRTGFFITHFVSELGNSIEISIYLKPGESPDKVAKAILSYKNIKDLKIISKEKEWKEFKKQLDIPEINNPLPDTIRVKVKDVKDVDNFIDTVKKWDSVEDIQYAGQIADKINWVGHRVNIAALIIIIALGGLTLSIINNTIHLIIEARKKEIEIMKMMGVSNLYIKAPYVLQGAFYGFCGAALAIIPLFILNSYLIKLMKFLYIQILPVNFNIVIISILVMGSVVGAFGSILAVRKYLKV